MHQIISNNCNKWNTITTNETHCCTLWLATQGPQHWASARRHRTPCRHHEVLSENWPPSGWRKLDHEKHYEKWSVEKNWNWKSIRTGNRRPTRSENWRTSQARKLEDEQRLENLKIPFEFPSRTTHQEKHHIHVIQQNLLQGNDVHRQAKIAAEF